MKKKRREERGMRRRNFFSIYLPIPFKNGEEKRENES
jgi:hypothetical protein